MAGTILDNGALVTLGLVAAVAAVGVVAKRGAANVKEQIGRDTYPSLFADDADDGVLNPDDPRPRIAGDRHGIEEVSIAQQVGKFIDLRSAMEPKLDRLLKIPFVNKIVAKKVLTGLGLEKVRLAVSGSAPIPAELIAWYRKLGLNLVVVI